MFKFIKQYKNTILGTLSLLLIALLIYFVGNSQLANGGKIPIISDIYENKIARILAIILIISRLLFNLIRDLKKKS